MTYTRLSLFLMLFLISIGVDAKGKSCIYVYRYDTFSPKMLNASIAELRKVYPVVKYAGKMELPAYAYYQEGKKECYTGYMLLNQLRRVQKSGVVIGFTDKGICYRRKESPHYRCMGYSGKIGIGLSVVTTERFSTAGNTQLYLNRLMLHELGHAFGLPHCQNVRCIMVAAKGANKFGSTPSFCRQCKSYLNSKGWKLTYSN